MSKRVAETGTSWPHYHGLYEIYFMLEGNCTYIIDDKVYNVQAGDIVIIPDGIIHHTKYDDINPVINPLSNNIVWSLFISF
jgi:quercetin dioxygenase-like cupin family protein